MDGDAAAPRHDPTGLRLLPPVPRPSKIIAVGRNYREHAAEEGQAAPADPIIFTKFPNALVGDGADIVWRAADTGQVDYEAELAVVVGRRAQGRPRRAGTGARPRLHLLQRRLGARPPVRGRAVGPGQEPGHVLPDRAVDRDHGRDPGSGRVAHPVPRQRGGRTGRVDGGDGPRGGRAHRLLFAVHDPRAGRRHRDRDARRRGGLPSAARGSLATATRSSWRSRASGGSRTAAESSTSGDDQLCANVPASDIRLYARPAATSSARFRPASWMRSSWSSNQMPW